MTKTKVAIAWGLQLYWKKTTAQVFSCEFYEIFKSTFFTPLNDCFCKMKLMKRAKFLKSDNNKLTREHLDDINFPIHKIDIDKS